MKHESIAVIYDSCQAIAEEIADKLGAETVCIQNLNLRLIENCPSFVLTIEFQSDGNLSHHWQYASQMFEGSNLTGKNIALLIAYGNKYDTQTSTELICSELSRSGAHIISDKFYADFFEHNLEKTSYLYSKDLDNWISAISPNL